MPTQPEVINNFIAALLDHPKIHKPNSILRRVHLRTQGPVNSRLSHPILM